MTGHNNINTKIHKVIVNIKKGMQFSLSKVVRFEAFFQDREMFLYKVSYT